jgi:hypothetical protein
VERIFTSWFLIGLGAVISSLAANEKTGTMLVLVYEEAGVEPDVFRAAQKEASAILAEAGIASEWVACVSVPPPDECRRAGQSDVLRVRIFPTAQKSIWKVDPQAFGFALSSPEPPFGTVAGIIYDRVQQLAGFRQSLLTKVLGCVLAHEIGHLLLNGGGHATGGLMKADWRKKEMSLIEQRTFRFLPAQAEEMARGLEARRLYMRSSGAIW